jgi:hypothetical protein
MGRSDAYRLKQNLHRALADAPRRRHEHYHYCFPEPEQRRQQPEPLHTGQDSFGSGPKPGYWRRPEPEHQVQRPLPWHWGHVGLAWLGTGLDLFSPKGSMASLRARMVATVGTAIVYSPSGLPPEAARIAHVRPRRVVQAEVDQIPLQQKEAR